MTTPLYTVRNWDALYENNDSRKIKNCRYVCTPNKHDGAGYGRMMAHPEGERLFAAWNAIIQVASKMPERGVLAKGGDSPGTSREHLTAFDLSFRTRIRVETFEMALSFFSSTEIGWLDVKPANLEGLKQLPDNLPGPPDNLPRMGEKFRIEGKGIEGNRREPQEGGSPSEEDEVPKKKTGAIQQNLIPHPLQEDPDFMRWWTGFLEMRVDIKKPATPLAQEALLDKLATLSGMDTTKAVEILKNSVVNNWQDVYPPKTENRNGHDRDLIGSEPAPYNPMRLN